MLGTVYFAAPEQFGFGQSDERTDIYGLGATINYIMTGDKPGAGIAQCRFTDILRKCLMVDARDRYQSATELREVLYIIGSQTGNRSDDSAFGTDNTEAAAASYRTVKEKITNTYRKYQNKNYNINSSWRRFLPPGFRGTNIICCIAALGWYALIILLSLSVTFTDSDTGVIMTGWEQAVYKIAIFIMLLGMTLWFGNYLNIRRKLPGMKKVNALSFILTCVYGFALCFALLMFFAIVVAIIESI